MKLEIAIEILELNIKEAGKHMPPDVKTALEIAVEAVKRCQWLRSTHQFLGNPLLPGETDDNGSK